MIGIAGLSHLGIVTSAATAAQGFDVVAYDADAERCASLARGRLPVVEPGLAELLAAHRARIRFTNEAAALRGCELIICASDVPTDEQDRSDPTVINDLLETVVHHAAPGSALVVLSQVPPGFTRTLANGAASALAVFYQVETLIFGAAVERALHPERFIVGCDDPSAALPAPYAAWLSAFGCPVLRMRYESAELSKIAINMLLASSVATAKTLAALCEDIGADWSEIVPALTSDRRIGPHAYVRPGLGIGGGNIPRDLATVRALADQHGTPDRDWVLRTLHREVLSHRPDPVIALWGLAYKPGTNSTTHSPAMDLLEVLGSPTAQITVQVYDPQVRCNGRHPRQLQAASALDACRGADALAIMTPWPEFAAVSLAQVREMLRGSVIVDPYGVTNGRECEALGLRHLRLGAPTLAGTC
ncbi:MAG: UDP-glucose/GDP-mannose dehydrogenase family protein [Candidatus Omnitrophica bacterium]|nr:UDP-glucose/GDP-mannose dehydrogenase family protein [Candidatus Omnitrophota bacterium]